MTTFGLRISCPDRPGRLGAVATALGRAGVNITSLDVVERTAGMAVDQLVVEADALDLQQLVAVVESVPMVVVEVVHTIAQAPQEGGPLALAANLLSAPGDVLEQLVSGVAEALNASWCVAVRERTPQPEVLASSMRSPSLVGAGVPWLPADGPRRLSPGPWVPHRWSLDLQVATFAIAPLASEREALLVARTRGPVFRARELDALHHLARIGAHLAATGSEVPEVASGSR